MMRFLHIAALTLLAACSGHVTSDQAELANIKSSHITPKSSPKQMVKTFDRFCVNGPTDPATAEVQFRKAGYVPLPRKNRDTRAYVVDDKRPSVAHSPRMCMVQLKARTGQTDRFARYVKRNFDNVQSLDPAPFGRDIEKAWRVSGPISGIITTRREINVDWHIYALILYREIPA